MKSILRALIVGASFASLSAGVHAVESFAAAVVSYTAGTGVGAYTDPTRALGKPSDDTGFGLLSPFNPHFAASQLARIGEGGQLTLQLANYVLVDNTAGVREIGIWENVGIADSAYPAGTAGATATVFGADSAIVEVSADNVTWFALNSGAPILFTLPGNYYANSTDPYGSTPPASPVLADFGKPFTGTLADFNGETYAQVLTTLDGSAGGTWLDIDSSFGLTQVGYVRFSGLGSGQTLEVDAVGINGALIGDAVPEPGAVGLALIGGLGLLLRRRRTAREISTLS